MKQALKRIYKKWKPVIVDSLLMQGYRHKIPDDIIIETTNICSLACSCCPNGVSDIPLRPRGVMSPDTFRRVLQNIDVKIRYCYLHMCGEPFLCPDLPQYVQELEARGITAVIFSNGYHIDHQLLRHTLANKKLRISFSADLLSPQHYEKIRRPAKYDVMLSELDAIDSVFAECNRFYGLNIIIDPSLLSEISGICQSLFKRFSRLNSISLNSQWPWPGLAQLGDLPGHMWSSPKICTQTKSSMPILHNGDVLFCTSDWKGATRVGNILNTPYSRIFNSPQARKFRRRLFRKRLDSLPLCADCEFPRYDATTLMIYRNKFLKASPTEQLKIMQPLIRYYDIWRKTENPD